MKSIDHMTLYTGCKHLERFILVHVTVMKGRKESYMDCLTQTPSITASPKSCTCYLLVFSL